ncbi:hypothetical protein SAMN04487881_2379 [Marinobacter sp. es.048]|uniref:ATP-binding protein n=1 Tax=Marinobacter sp. es.048 TaxID=1761795 RepID=UPI000B71017A|nr:ATP-binding protein [Marinobacter sp. es.048]SNC74478.1 hypothetical protein SAMN04487881_2379 [Marinobacter sp. es.048]
MIDINFTNIRAFDGSRNSGFEELVCQLAHLEKPANAKRFIRKEGAGGDAGVECYWILNDDNEICWQAKYFTGEMSSSRWGQLDESFKTALSKHPNMSNFIVCLPLDKTDSRKTGKGGKTVTSVEDEWRKLVEKWTKFAAGRTIKFEFWGKHELTTMLAVDDPRYSGRLLYWFNEPALRSETLRHLALKSRETLGERFTPEFHVDLPIARQLDGLCANDGWWSEISAQKAALEEKYDKFIWVVTGDKIEDVSGIDLTGLESAYTEFLARLTAWLKNKPAKYDLIALKQALQNIVEPFRELGDLIEGKTFKEESGSRDFRQHFGTLYSSLREIQRFLQSRKAHAYEIGAGLLYGEAGIGKSHLLCDLALHRANESLPTIFLLGAQYGGGNPLDFVRQSLDLHQFSNNQVLAAIDAAGEARKRQALIVIDAINEGPYRDQWRDFIRGFLSDISRFENVSLLISCRSTYCGYMLPDSVDETCLIQFHHQGFQGFEHRAAEKYLSAQGISKPSAPILAPEFSNPLFLKACCKALRSSGQSSFPKGLSGLTQLFEFYLKSVEKTIAVRKQYSPAEKIVQSALAGFSSRLYPDYLSGIPIGDARKLVNDFDISPQKGGDDLFGLLLHEGVLAEDISYENDKDGHPVIRYTYERFSDVLVARQIIAGHDSKTVATIFDEEEPLGQILGDRGVYQVAGILEALFIAIAEKFQIELIDLIPEGVKVSPWEIRELFENTVLWRSPDSFSDRTLEILNNNVGTTEYSSPALDILLKLSTEPDHPWNAERLHRNLKDKEIAERDHFWSIHVARGDSSEEDGHESTERTLIEWACFGDIRNAEDERIRLCAIVLLWFLTTSNRKVRDCATKSLVRLFVERTQIIEGLFSGFCDVNDLYLVERLYAAVYGALCNIEEPTVITDIAKLVFDKIFADGQPIPHILLRDYARGVLEIALSKGLLPKGIEPQSFRPPYKSSWPLDNPTKEEIDELIGDDDYSDIKSSLMGFPGDFGNYTMSCVHDWSCTPIDQDEIQNGYELKVRFAEELLDGDLKEEFLAFIGPEEREPVDIKKWLAQVKGEVERERPSDEDIRRRRDEREAFLDRIRESLDSQGQEDLRWLTGLANDRPAAFSRKWAQHWVCKRAYELGWNKELFSSFESSCSRGRGGGSMERVGKKYQWIGFHEFLAHLSDNMHWIDREYSDVEDRIYYGPWQLHRRDTDPTNWLRKNGEYRTFHNEQTTWWQPYRFPIDQLQELEAQKFYLWDRKKVPDFPQLLTVSKSAGEQEWCVLRGFWSQKQRKLGENSKAPYLDCWFRINSVIVTEGDFDKIKEMVSNESLIDPDTVSIPKVSDGFLGEYPWHPVYDQLSNWQEEGSDVRSLISEKHMVPVSEYSWERGNVDHSIDETLSIYLPAKELVNELGMERMPNEFGSWRVGEDIVFTDPSVEEYGPSYALMRTDALNEWMAENNMKILWLIGGEKQLFASDFGSSEFFGRLVYSGVYWLENDRPVGSLHFRKEE